jgi:hypothetical protein
MISKNAGELFSSVKGHIIYKLLIVYTHSLSHEGGSMYIYVTELAGTVSL